MTLIILVILIIIIIIIIYNFFHSNYIAPFNNMKSKCWIDTSLFKESEKIFNSRNIIIKELNTILDSNKWGVWSSDYKKTPKFSEMNDMEILQHVEKNTGSINSDKNNPAWRLYGLILNKIPLENSKNCPETMKLLSKYSNRILNAGFSLLEPGSYIGSHHDDNNMFYRLHIPLITPTNNNIHSNTVIDQSTSKGELAVLQLENDYRIWKDSEYFIINDTCQHNAWNNTDQNRIVLLIDILNGK